VVDPNVILAALIGAIVWNLVTWWLGLPSSSSHALIGGLGGAAIAKAGSADSSPRDGSSRSFLFLLSPIIGMRPRSCSPSRSPG
jgi:PiT family inorganic phosphate transporter